MKKIAALLLVFVLLFGFTSCTVKNGSELKRRLIIQGIGLDLAEDGMLLLSVQALNTDVSTHASSNSEPESLVKLYSVKARTLSEAVKQISAVTGKNPVLSQNRIVVFGYELAKRGVGKYLDDFFRNDENRFSVLCLVSKTTAKEIIYAGLGDNVIPARLTEKILLGADYNYEITKTSILKLRNTVLSENTACAVPVAELEKDENFYKINISGSAVFLDGKLMFTVDNNITSGINILNSKLKKSFFSVELSDGTNVSYEMLSCHTSIKTDNSAERPVFNIEISGSLSVDEIDSERFLNTSYEDIEFLEEEAQEHIKKLVNESIKKCVIENSLDVFGFSVKFKNKNEAIELIKNSDYNISVNLRIKRMGDSAVSF